MRCDCTRLTFVLLATRDIGCYAVGRLLTTSKLSTTQNALRNVTLVAKGRIVGQPSTALTIVGAEQKEWVHGRLASCV